MSSGAAASHSLAFRVMRLCRPSFDEGTPIRVDPIDLIVGEDICDDPVAELLLAPIIRRYTAVPTGPSDMNYCSRFLSQHPADSFGPSGLLVLPQSFGAIYLGETFCSYVSINNHSSFEVKDVVIKAEIQTERQKIQLLDPSALSVDSIRAGGHYDFIAEHDVKELGAHMLVCTAIYRDCDGERKYLPQFFKFVVANPLSVRTKVRTVKERTFLEASVENSTKTNLFMDQVEFEPAQHWSAKMLIANEASSGEAYKTPVIIRSGGIHNYLYQLCWLGFAQSNVLGKLQITWRTNLGEPGRLQTQQIIGTPIVPKDIDLHVVEIPSIITFYKPFLVHLNLKNQTERELGPFEFSLSQTDSPDEKVVLISGLQKLELPKLQAFGATKFCVSMIASKVGIHKITDITIFDKMEQKTYDSLLDLEIFVGNDDGTVA